MGWVEVIGVISSAIAAISSAIAAWVAFWAAKIAKEASEQWKKEKKAEAKANFIAALLDYRSAVIATPVNTLFDDRPEVVALKNILGSARSKCERYWLLSEYNEKANYNTNSSPDDNGRRLYKYYDNFKANHDRYVTNNLNKDGMVEFCDLFHSKLPFPYSDE